MSALDSPRVSTDFLPELGSDSRKQPLPKQSLEIAVDSLDSDGKPAPIQGGESSVFRASLNLTNAVVGVGLFYIHDGFHQGGVTLFILLFFIVGIACYYTALLLIQSGEETGIYSYEDLAAEVVGPWAYYLLAAFCIVLNWGACLAYLATAQKMMPGAIRQMNYIALGRGDHWITGDLPFMILVLAIVLPLSMLKNMDALGFVSSVKVCVLGVVCIVLFWAGTTKEVRDYQNIQTWSAADMDGWLRQVNEGGYKKFKSSGKLTEVLQKFETKQPNNLVPIDPTNPDPKAPTRPKWFHDVNQTFQADPTFKKNWGEICKKRCGVDKKKIRWGAQGTFYKGLGTVLFSVVYHDSAFSIYKSLEQPTISNFTKYTLIGTGLISTTYISVGLFAYIVFVTNLPDMLLTVDPMNSVFPNVDTAAGWATNIIRICFGIVLLLTYPICSLICREYTESVINKLQGKPSNAEQPFWVRTVITFSIAGAIMGCIAAGASDKADTVIDVTGAIGSGMIAFTLPAIIYFSAFGWQKCLDGMKKCLADPEASLWTKTKAVSGIVMPILTCGIGTLASLFAFGYQIYALSTK